MGISGLKQATDSGDVHAFAARVQAWPGETNHYETNEEGDIIVHCIRHHGGTPIKANLGGVDASGNGSISIPDPGTEVMIGSDSGDFEGELYLMERYPTGKAPDGLVPGTRLIISPTVEIRSTTANVIGDTVNIGAALGAQPIPKGLTQNTALSSFVTGMNTFVIGVAALGVALNAASVPTGPYPDPDLVTACATFATLCTTFEGVLAAFTGAMPGWLATKGNVV